MNERFYQRAKLNAEVIISNGASQQIGKAVNISLGGIFLRCQEAFPIGGDVELILKLPSSKQLTLKGKVRRVVNCDSEDLPIGMGISFEDVPEESKAKIEEYVRRTIRLLKALFYELNRARINEGKIKELLAVSPIEYQYPLDILREKIAAELSNLRLRPYNKK